MLPSFLAIFAILASFSLQPVKSGDLHTNEVIIERVEGPPPITSKYLAENSGAHVRRNGRKSTPTVNIMLNLTQTIPNSTTIVIQATRRQNNAYRTPLLNYKSNLCRYLANETRPFVTVLKPILGLPDSCPVGPGVFKVDNWNVADILPKALPLAEGLKITVEVQFDKDDVLQNSAFLRFGHP